MSAFSQVDDGMKSIVALTGAESAEYLDEELVERYSSFLSRPLQINIASRSRLVSSGLLSQYQVASLEDYRARYGDVLSFTELATLNGFSKEYVAAIRPFVSLESRSLPGMPAKDTVAVSQDAVLRLAERSGEWNYGLKYKFSYGQRVEVAAAARTAYSDRKPFPPSAYSFYAVVYGKHVPGKLVVGDFNARFGQGLALWSGFSLTGFSSSASFYQRPNGISPSWSYSGTGTHRGVAADISLGRFVVSAIASFSSTEFLPAVNVAWYGRNGQVSMTDVGARKLAADARWTWKGADIFGEYAFDFTNMVAGGVAGAVVPIGDDWRVATVFRYYPTLFGTDFTGGVKGWSKTANEYGLAMGVDAFGASFTADLARKMDSDKQQCKLLLKVPLQLTPTMVLTMKGTERIRPYEVLRYRTDVRLDLDYCSAGLSSIYGATQGDAWTARLRVEGLLCRSLGVLTYVEGGRKTDRLSAYLRGTFYRTESWDDRIYSYERDAPGNFTVPAYYGTGFAFSAVAGYKLRLHTSPWRSAKMYLRASVRKSAVELKFQVVLAL